MSCPDGMTGNLQHINQVGLPYGVYCITEEKKKTWVTVKLLFMIGDLKKIRVFLLVIGEIKSAEPNMMLHHISFTHEHIPV